MAPAAIESRTLESVQPKWIAPAIPDSLKARMEKAGIDVSGYPTPPENPLYYQDAVQLKSEPWEYNDAGARADQSKSSLMNAATKVTDLTRHIGTEIEGLQLKDLTPQQRDELALLISERSVVFFRDQDISPQQQEELARYYGRVEIHPHVPHVPGVEGATVGLNRFQQEKDGKNRD